MNSLHEHSYIQLYSLISWAEFLIQVRCEQNAHKLSLMGKRIPRHSEMKLLSPLAWEKFLGQGENIMKRCKKKNRVRHPEQEVLARFTTVISSSGRYPTQKNRKERLLVVIAMKYLTVLFSYKFFFPSCSIYWTWLTIYLMINLRLLLLRTPNLSPQSKTCSVWLEETQHLIYIWSVKTVHSNSWSVDKSLLYIRLAPY